jgi:hypothetical protein
MTESNIKERTNNSLINKVKQVVASQGKKVDAVVQILIDYPKENEKVFKGSYGIRISAEPHSEVEISIDGADWQPCREAVGYWWFDWKPGITSSFKIIARSRIGKGKWKKSEARTCHVIAN